MQRLCGLCMETKRSYGVVWNGIWSDVGIWYNVICRHMIQAMIRKDINLWCRAIQRAGITVCFTFRKGSFFHKSALMLKSM